MDGGARRHVSRDSHPPHIMVILFAFSKRKLCNSWRPFSPEFANVRAFRKLLRSSRHDSADGPHLRFWEEGNQRAEPLAPNLHRDILLCSDFSEHTRPPRSAGDGRPGSARLSHPCQQRLRRYRQRVSWPSPSTDDRLHKHKERVTPRGSSHARCHQDMVITLVRVSTAHETTRLRNTW